MGGIARLLFVSVHLLAPVGFLFLWSAHLVGLFNAAVSSCCFAAVVRGAQAQRAHRDCRAGEYLAVVRALVVILAQQKRQQAQLSTAAVSRCVRVAAGVKVCTTKTPDVGDLLLCRRSVSQASAKCYKARRGGRSRFCSVHLSDTCFVLLSGLLVTKNSPAVPIFAVGFLVMICWINPSFAMCFHSHYAAMQLRSHGGTHKSTLPA